MKSPKALRRQPRGVLASKPVFCKLMPDERVALEALSQHAGNSLSYVMREIFLAGVGPYRRRLSTGSLKHTQNRLRANEQ